jgi:Asp/Glu/hydantoin racemase
MPSLLLLNPNTTEAVTQRVLRRAREVLPPEAELRGATASFGAAYIASEQALAVAAHAALRAFEDDARHHPPPDAVLLACFGDPGLFALREHARLPVIGLAEAAMREATSRGPYAIVTGGSAWPETLLRLARSLGLAEALIDTLVVPATGAELLAEPAVAQRLLVELCRQAKALGARSVVLGGAALTDFAPALQSAIDVPLIDSVACGLHSAWAAAQAGTGLAAPNPVASDSSPQARTGALPDENHTFPHPPLCLRAGPGRCRPAAGQRRLCAGEDAAHRDDGGRHPANAGPARPGL